MKALLLVGWVAAFILAIATYPAAAIVARTAVEAYIIAAKDPAAVEVERAIFEPPKAPKDSKAYRDAVMRIYGSQTDEATAVVFVPQERFLHPQELPTLTLLPVDKQKGQNPLQVKTVYFFASRSVAGFAVAGIVFLGVWLFLRRKKPSASPAAPTP